MNKINPRLLEIIEKAGIDKNGIDQNQTSSIEFMEDGLLYAAALQLGIVMSLYRRGLFKDDKDEHKFRILLCDEDPDNDTIGRKYKLKHPLWVNEVEEDLWDDFYKWLVKNPKLVQHKGRFSSTLEGKKAFEELSGEKGFDMNRFKACVETYYNREGQYAKALPKFLMENAKGEYEGYKTPQTFGIL